MGMAEDDDLRVGILGLQLLGSGTAELIAMRDDDREAVQLHAGDAGELAPKRRAVGVPVDRGDRGDRPQLIEDALGAHVTAVQDMVDLRKHLEDLASKQPVGIRDHADPHADPQSTRRAAAAREVTAPNAVRTSVPVKVQCP